MPAPTLRATPAPPSTSLPKATSQVQPPGPVHTVRAGDSFRHRRLRDESVWSSDEIRALIERFGCACGGEVVPCHLCANEQPAVIGSTVALGAQPREHAGHAMPISSGGLPAEGEMAQMAHGMGHGARMSMDQMVRPRVGRELVA